MDNNDFNLRRKRMILYQRKKRRKRLRFYYIFTLSSLLLIFIITSSLFGPHNSKNVTTVIKSTNSLENSASTNNSFKVCIDPGHGGSDVGTEGVYNSYEKDIDLAVSLKLAKILKKNNIDVVLTRSDDNLPTYESSNDSLKDRIKVSKISKVTLFVSIHCNSDFNDEKTKGVETWFKKGDPDSKTFASYLQYYLADLKYTDNRKLKTYDNSDDALAVLEKNTATAVLVELGFISNKDDEQYLNYSANQEELASSIAKGILEYKKDYLSK